MSEKNQVSRGVSNNLAGLGLIGVVVLAWFANNLWLKLAGWPSFFYAFFVTLFCVLVYAFTESARSLWAFYKNASAELAKVAWPSKDEVVRVTGTVIVVVFLVSLILWCVDAVLFSLVSMLTRF